MQFSFIVPFLNEQPYIGACIEALITQEGAARDCEFIFIDNGSTDESRGIVQAHPEIILLDEPQQDPYLARNRGIQVARGAYIVFLDADCALRPGALEAYRRAIENRPPDVLLGNLLHLDPVPMLLQCHQDYYNTKTGWLLQQGLRECYYGHAGNMVVKKSVFDEVGLFKGMPEVGDTAILHDLMAVRPDARIVHVPGAGAVHLEVTRFSQCLEKLRRSGVYTRDYERVHGYRTLTMKEKISIMQTCASQYRYGVIKRLLLLYALYAGWRAFEKGRSM